MVGRYGHDAHPVMDFLAEVDSIVALEKARAGGPVSDELLKRVNAALDFAVGVDDLAIVAKDELRKIADVLRRELGVKPRDPGVAQQTITAPNGAIYHLTLDGDDLWIHVEPAPGKTVRMGYEANAGNEGWLRLEQRVALRSAMPLRPRTAA